MDVFVAKVQARPINGQWSLVKKIGEGGFSAVYLGRNLTTHEEAALKLEHKSVVPSILSEEAERYKSVESLTGIPKVYWYGWHDDYRVLAFELLGPSLEDLYEYCGCQFSLKTTLMVADQLLPRLRALHEREMLHRDVKPQNCLLGCGINGNVVYITDFGLADEHEHTMAREDDESSITRQPRLLGTARYASIRGHEGRAQSPKDDLESLGYMLLYFIKGKLPWQGLKAHDGAEKERLVMEKKKSLTADQLCAGLPVEFAQYMQYVKSLRRGETPDYSKLRERFQAIATREGMEYDNVFDWTEREYLKQVMINDSD
ncbi:hypothetical protein B0A50_08485 [Salinomyces thailandicus]|uniref:non-specific serine/threonine protein kinase n=1 Tax=Salinomyces thailandicus TaxID=706561 RepID=A0A4U0TJP9_9PEZI|nr:hypothetical protein B0A50_08485 [Salinomyces thailandica]